MCVLKRAIRHMSSEKPFDCMCLQGTTFLTAIYKAQDQYNERVYTTVHAVGKCVVLVRASFVVTPYGG